MPYTWQALSAVWIIIFAVFAVLASTTLTGSVQFAIMLGGFAAPIVILAIDDKRRKTPRPASVTSAWPNAGFRNIGRRTRVG